MKRYIKASSGSLLDEFLKYHEDPQCYQENREGFDAMYAILDKYGTENENVDEVFVRATPEDQQKMVDLIRPKKKGPSVTPDMLRRKFNQLQNKYERETTSEYEEGYYSAMCDMIDAFGIDI